MVHQLDEYRSERDPIDFPLIVCGYHYNFSVNFTLQNTSFFLITSDLFSSTNI